MDKLKVPILDECPECKEQAFLPSGTDVSNSAKVYSHYLPCPICEGAGRKTR